MGAEEEEDGNDAADVDFSDGDVVFSDADVDLQGMQMHSGDPRDVRQCRESNPALSSGLPLLSEGDHRDQNYMRVIIVNRIVLK